MVLVALFICITASALSHHDFTAENALGQEIYYTIIDEDLLTVEVAQHNSYNSPYMGQYGELENQDVIIPSTVENDGKTYTVVAIGDYAFRAGVVSTFDMTRTNGIKSIVLPNTIKSIGEEAFSESKNLIAVTLSEGLTSIGDDAFYCCTSLLSIVLPSTMQTIGARAFGWYSDKMSLKSVFVKGIPSCRNFRKHFPRSFLSNPLCSCGLSFYICSSRLLERIRSDSGEQRYYF